MNEPIGNPSSPNEAYKNKPVNARQFDRVQAAIWRQDSESGESKEPFFSVTFSRNYRDANGQWQRTGSFTARDLPHLQLAVEWAMRELLLKPE